MKMLVYLKTGYYSIVHKEPCNKDELLIRAHSKSDIDQLQHLLKTKYEFDGKLLDTTQTSYEYSMIVPQKTFASFMSIAINDLVHDSFKYTKSWQATYQWQRNLVRCT
jgi:hypothetical protein